MGKIVAIANQKGGVGKTTTTVNLAASLGLLEKKVLIIDADPQANATSGVGITPPEIGKSTYDILINKASPSEAILATSTPNLDIIPSHIDLVGAEVELINRMKREFILKDAVAELDGYYDYIFIDCAPSLGLITINALTAADSVIIPIQCEMYSLEGLGKLKNTISLVQEAINPQLTIEGILMTMYDSRLRLSSIMSQEIKDNSADNVFDTIIHRNSKIGEAPNMHIPVALYDATCKGSQNFLELALEFLGQNDDTIHQSEDNKVVA